MIPRLLSMLRERILHHYAALTTGHTPCVYHSRPGAHDAVYFQPAKPLTPSPPPPVGSWPTLSPSVPCSQQPWRSYNYTWMSPICWNSFASLIGWRARRRKSTMPRRGDTRPPEPRLRRAGLSSVHERSQGASEKAACLSRKPACGFYATKKNTLNMSSSHAPLKDAISAYWCH